MIQILGLLGIYFDAVVVFVTNSSLLFRLAMAILLLLFSTVSVQRENVPGMPLLVSSNCATCTMAPEVPQVT
jgi:hypothetical protein